MGAWQPAYTLANAKQSNGGGGCNSTHISSPVNAPNPKNSSAKGSVTSIAGHQGVGNRPNSSLGSANGLANADGREMSGGRSDGYATGSSPDGSSLMKPPGQVSGLVDGRMAGAGLDSAQQNGGSAPVAGAVSEQPPSQSWGQAQVASERQSESLSKQQDHDGYHQDALDQSAGQTQGIAQVEAVKGQGHRENGRWQQGQRQPQDQGQKQGSGPGQIQTNHQETVGQDDAGHVAYPKGEVYGYRMALWLEHLGGKHDPMYDQPQSLACVKQVNYLAEQNWLQFSGEEECDMSGHLITFPIVVDRSGAVSARTKNGHFSDIDNTIQGKKQPIPARFLN